MSNNKPDSPPGQDNKPNVPPGPPGDRPNPGHGAPKPPKDREVG